MSYHARTSLQIFCHTNLREILVLNRNTCDGNSGDAILLLLLLLWWWRWWWVLLLLFLSSSSLISIVSSLKQIILVLWVLLP